MVDNDQREQRLGNGRGAYAHAGVVATFGLHAHGLALQIDGFALRHDGAGGLNGQRHFNILPRADAAQYAARMESATECTNSGSLFI